MRVPAAIALLLALVGCGGGGSGSSSAPSPAPVVPVPPAPVPAPPTPPTYTPITAAKPTVGVALPLGKCVNIGNDLEAPNEGDWGPAVTDADFTTIKQGGFGSIRLPVRFSGHAGTTAPYTIDAAFMARVRHVVDAATAAGLNVIIDMHDYDELFADPAGNKDRFAGLWKQVAAEFADEPGSVWFELINEPHDQLTNANLLSVDAPALAAIRETNKTRPVIVGGEDYSSLASLATLPFPDDPNLVPTFHYYDPYEFTHQGVSFLDNPPPKGRLFGGADDIAALDANLKTVQAFIQSSGRVPFVGEYGANDEAIPTDQRVQYYATVSSAWASIGVQSCAWAYRNTFKLRDGDAWLPGILDAIATTTTAE